MTTTAVPITHRLECRRFTVLTPTEQTDQPRAPRETRVQYVCREHGTPVTWQGTGCPHCLADPGRRARRKRRRGATVDE